MFSRDSLLHQLQASLQALHQTSPRHYQQPLRLNIYAIMASRKKVLLKVGYLGLYAF